MNFFSLKRLTLTYPAQARSVTVDFQDSSARLQVHYITFEGKKFVVSKSFEKNLRQEILKEWEQTEKVLSGKKTEIGCLTSMKWLVEFQNGDKKIFCLDKEATHSVGKFQSVIQKMML